MSEVLDVISFKAYVYKWLSKCLEEKKYSPPSREASEVFLNLEDIKIIKIDKQEKIDIYNDCKEKIKREPCQSNKLDDKFEFSAFKNGVKDLTNKYEQLAIKKSREFALQLWVQKRVLNGYFNIKDLIK